MANRPAQLCELQKGKFIDSQQGFVDTFNWAVRAIDNLEGTGKVKVDWTIDDRPTITMAENSDSDGGGGYGKVVEDVTSETQGGDDGLKIWYTDGTDKFIELSGGGGSLSGVQDVTAETYNGGESIKVEYTNGQADGHIPLSFVKYVTQQSLSGTPNLKIQYSSNAPDSYIPLTSSIKITGTDGGSVTRNDFTLASASDSCVSATVDANGTITLGVYYV